MLLFLLKSERKQHLLKQNSVTMETKSKQTSNHQSGDLSRTWKLKNTWQRGQKYSQACEVTQPPQRTSELQQGR